jgi:hypothetical protein
MDLTPREAEVLEYLRKFYVAKGRMPTNKELQLDLKIINNGFKNRILNKLVECGYITKIKPPIRSILYAINN